MRGPMPPFPYAWEGVQLLMHLVEPVIRRQRRLGRKLVLLEAWLARLVQRARVTVPLQKFVSAFVEVA